MKITLVTTDPYVATEWDTHVGLARHIGDYFDVKADAVVSPANSFGFMDGNLDARITEFFGTHLQRSVQNRIQAVHGGELLVGQAFGIQTMHQDIPWCIISPTMRVPRRIDDFNDIYLATRAAVRIARQLSIGRLTLPAFGAGCGEAPARAVALAMRDGIKDAVNPPPFPKTWKEAQDAHAKRGYA